MHVLSRGGQRIVSHGRRQGPKFCSLYGLRGHVQSWFCKIPSSAGERGTEARHPELDRRWSSHHSYQRDREAYAGRYREDRQDSNGEEIEPETPSINGWSPLALTLRGCTMKVTGIQDGRPFVPQSLSEKIEGLPGVQPG